MHTTAMKTIPAFLLAFLLFSIAGISLSGCMKCSSSKEESCPPSPELLKSITLAEIGPEGKAWGKRGGRGPLAIAADPA